MRGLLEEMIALKKGKKKKKRRRRARFNGGAESCVGDDDYMTMRDDMSQFDCGKTSRSQESIPILDDSPMAEEKEKEWRET